MSMVNINWRPDAKELRKFGITVLIGFGIIGLVFQLVADKMTAAYVAYIAGAVLGLPALTGTVIALPGYRLWMGVAFVMGNIMSRLLLGVFFYGLITPMGLARRLTNDKLRLRRPAVDSYWTDLPADNGKDRFERQF
jgi:hypothetical protein